MELSRGARRTLQALQYFFNGKPECWPRQETIARRVRCDVRTIKRHIAELRCAGVLEIRRRANQSCVYTLCKEMSLPFLEGTNVPSVVPSVVPSTFKELEGVLKGCNLCSGSGWRSFERHGVSFAVRCDHRPRKPAQREVASDSEMETAQTRS